MNAEPKNDVPAPASVPASVQTIDVGPATASVPVSADPDAAPAEAKAPAGQPATVSPERLAPPPAPKTILVIDIGGTKVKMMAMGQTEPIKFASGPEFTPARLVETVQKHSKGWDYEAIS